MGKSRNSRVVRENEEIGEKSGETVLPHCTKSGVQEKCSLQLQIIMGTSFLEKGPIMCQCCPSVRPSVCPVLPPRGKTKRPTNTKLGRKSPWDTSTPWTNFEVKGSKVKVTGHGSCVNVSLIIRPSNVGYSTSVSGTLLCHRERFTGWRP